MCGDSLVLVQHRLRTLENRDATMAVNRGLCSGLPRSAAVVARRLHISRLTAPASAARADDTRSGAMGILAWVVLGLIAGVLASAVMRGGFGIAGDIIVGIVGALL